MECPERNIRVDFVGLPNKDGAEFSNYLQYPRRVREPSRIRSRQQQERIIGNKNRAPYASFGDRGTTASAGKYGNLVRICHPIQGKHGSHLHSRLIGLGPLDDPEAWYVYWRTSQFLENTEIPENGIGLSVPEAFNPAGPHLEFWGDRWPLFSYVTKEGFEVEVRLWCQDNVVVQQARVTNMLNGRWPLHLTLNPNFRLQDLDYQEKREPIRLHRDSGPHGYGFIAVDDSPCLTMSDKRVCVLLGLFKDGEAQELPFDTNGSKIKPLLLFHQFDGPGTVEFTVAIKFQMSTLKADWRYFMILPEELIFDPQIDAADGLMDSLKGVPEVTWHLCRNLEHIMSVCNVPLSAETDNGDPEMMDEEVRDWSDARSEDHLRPAAEPTVVLQGPDGQEAELWSAPVPKLQVALTCGDFGDHRVSVSGSYFAFMFMLSMYERLPCAPATRQRIHAICSGHLAWISQLDADEASCSNVRIDGRRMNRSDETALPPDGPANMPSHIIKATQYLKVFTDRDDLLFVCSWLGRFAEKWFQKLAQEKNPLTPTWQHLSDSEIPVYRLSDQVWIWKALKSIEELIHKVKLMEDKVLHETLKEFLQISDHLPRRGVHKPSTGPRLEFTAEEMRRQNLRRFAVDNDVLKKRMLSVTRTARETRFLLHSRDTVLYYGLEWGFFAGEEPQWENLINAQTQHDEASNDQSQWDNPLRYGLAIEMAKEGHQLERTFTPSEMLTYAKEIILNSSSANGLFPGQLNGFSKEAALFDRELFRDFYFHVGFEIPYILLRSTGTLGRHETESHMNDGATKALSRTTSWADEPQSPHRRPIFTEPAIGVLPGYLSIQADGRAVEIQTTLKRLNPYGRLVDLSNIVEVPEEWLYKYPDFLDFAPSLDKKKLEVMQIAAMPAIQEGIKAGIFQWSVMGNSKTEVDISMRECYATIDDVRKGRKQRKWSAEEKSLMIKHTTYGSFWDHLSRQRNAGDSKKRLVYLGCPDSILAAMCYVASPELERVRVSQFFDRHAKVHANYLYDDTAPVFNSWVTELHFRFLQTCTRESLVRPRQKFRRARRAWLQLFRGKAYVVDAVISFRIVGDFFDRYWTCHVAQNFPNLGELDLPLNESERNQSTHWQQRKVLELILLNMVLKKACSSVKDILRSIELGRPLTTTDGWKDYAAYDFNKGFEFRDAADLCGFLDVLVALKNNISSLQVLIAQWNNRESLKGRERPRWTRNDEQKYRKTIKQKLVQFEDHVREVKATAARIEFLIARVTDAQDAIRTRKSLKDAENIKVFTYVTVIFLPVGLAVSIFSMNGIPDHTVIASMLVAAVVALLVTAGVLWCAVHRIIIDYLKFTIIGFLCGC